jgi:hypothetical protein
MNKNHMDYSQGKKLAWLLILVLLVLGVVVYKANKKTDIEVDLNISQGSASTALRLSPTSGTVGLNQTITVDLTLDTGGENVDGVDVSSLRFNPSILQVVDGDAGASGVQIAPTNLLPVTSYNQVNNTTGQIQFSQTTSGGSTFNGSGKIATITFRGNASGTSTANFDFTLNSTLDTNVSSAGIDKLSIVQNASFTVDAAGPTVSITSPAGNSTATGTITVAASASDNVGVAGVQFKVDGTNIGAEDTSSPYSVSWNSTAVTNGSHTLTAVARDTSGLTATSIGVAVNVVNTISKSVTINNTYEGRTSRVGSGKVSVLTSSKGVLQEPTYTTNTAGNATISINILPQQIYLKVYADGYLTRMMGPYDFNAMPTSVTVTTLKAGDLVADNIVNSIDFSYMNSKWFATDQLADINQDGTVNSIDFSNLNRNWFQIGEN